MAAKKDGKMEAKNAKNAAERAVGPGAWRVLMPFAGAALAALGPALVLGGQAIRDRREQSLRMPGLAVIPVVGGLLAVLGAVMWRNRERVLEIAGDALATAEEAAGGVIGRLMSETAPDESATSDSSYETFRVPVTRTAPTA